MSVSLICKHTRREEKTCTQPSTNNFLAFIQMQMRTVVDFNIFAAVFRERLCKFLFTVRDNLLPTRCSTWNENNFPHGNNFFSDSRSRLLVIHSPAFQSFSFCALVGVCLSPHYRHLFYRISFMLNFGVRRIVSQSLAFSLVRFSLGLLLRS